MLLSQILSKIKKRNYNNIKKLEDKEINYENKIKHYLQKF